MRRKRWVISKNLKTLLWIAIGLSVFMLANTLYLLSNRLAENLNITFFTAKNSIPLLLQTMILSHTGVGILLVVLMLSFGFMHLPRVWKMYRPKSGLSGIGFMLVGLLLGISGLFILNSAASRDNLWAWWIHVICAVLAPAGYIIHRMNSRGNKPENRSYIKFSGAVGILLVLMLVGHIATKSNTILTEEAKAAIEKGMHQGPGAKARNVKDYSDSDYVPLGYVPPESPFFPSATTTTSGDYLPSRIITRGELGDSLEIKGEIDRYGFVKNTAIGAATCARCHQDIVAQWESSAHRFASFNNPFYEATVTDMRNHANEPNKWVDKHINQFSDFGKDGIGRAKSKWCSGCHDPSLMLAGKMNRIIDRNTPEAQAGLTCLACHSMDKIHNKTGNANYNIADEQEDPYLFANSKDGSFGAFLHDAAIKAKPEVHMEQMMQPFFKKSEYCLTCHKVSLPESVNNYRWLRGQDEYDNWHDSGVSLNASRTFYLPPFKKECQDCHMPPESAPLGDLAAKNGMVRSHRFIAANTALPFLRNDTATLRKIESFLQSDKLHVDIFALKRANTSKLLMGLNYNELVLKSGEEVTVDIVVRNKGVGHTFPGGTNDSNEGWLEFNIKDEDGNTLLISGFIDEKGHLDRNAHTYKSVLVDKNSNPIHQRNAQDIRATVYTNVIGPGTADIAHYTFTIPEEFENKRLSMNARLLFRKFDRNYMEYAYRSNPEGFKQFKEIPELPITEIASDRVEFLVNRDTSSLRKTDVKKIPSSDWIRFNDYGIGLLLEGDSRGAIIAFEKVAELRPDNLDGPLNLAKTALREGNIEETYRNLRICEEIKKGDPQVAWVWARVRQEDGLYQDAIAAYNYVLQYFPEDRVARRQLGRTYYLDQQYQESILMYESVLDIDPEDREAYYHLALNYRAIGNLRKATIMEQAFKYYSIDESASEAAQKYRKKNPGDNIMAQDIKIHKLKF
ncbi:tetratricopeptide repeat protein [Lutimonas zeaxanthinifaciens]|uniref:tetratricopeptide repeat protein n=1 Tax=Lutimonas zeaxanthinifaciens TaxID=3060215 RepID=UPI00265CD984|nr:tetratricopeptide repeat protein [Lutimonas sp. YSD2104]WKK64913.1 multiheme c-type cytochrome [Lutimonas sp. YSD2104]